jgi:hypothetical protein
MPLRSAKGGAGDESLECRPMISAPTETNDAPLLLCPACGFDLRATTSDRCGECGLEIDRQGLHVSGIPWAHRDRMGRAAAYLKTVRLVSLDRDIRYEAAKPQELRDGRSFRRLTACLVAVALIGTFVAALVAAGGHVALAVQRDVLNPTWAPLNRRVPDVAVPWSAGATIPGVLPACLAALAFWIAGAQRFAFRTPRSTPEGRARSAVAFSYYTTAPLLLLVPAMACWTAVAMIKYELDTIDAQAFPRLSLLLATAGGVIALAAVLLTLLRIAQWLARTRPCGPERAILGAAEVLGLWLLGGIALLGLAPWCAGFLWVALDSLR